MLAATVPLQCRTIRILHSPGSLKSLGGTRGFEVWILRLNPACQNKFIYRWSLPMKIKERVKGKNGFDLILGTSL
jgi:hypothetical protein